MKKLSVVVPVYFNTDSLPMLFEELRKLENQLSERNLALELIFVDDGSGDDSLSRIHDIKRQRPETKVIKLTRNFGAIRCSKTGMHFVTGDAFIILAADMQDPPELIMEMVEYWSKGSKFIICERISRDDPVISRIFSWMYYRLLRLMVLKGYPYGGFDMALMDKALLPYLVNSAKNTYTPLLEFWLGYKPDVIRYHRPKRMHGKSKWTFKKKCSAFLDVMLGFSVTPIRMMSAIGAMVALISFLFGIWTVSIALAQRIPVEGFATIVCLLTFLLGIIISMLGIIGEYLWRIFEETNKRPETVIEEIW